MIRWMAKDVARKVLVKHVSFNYFDSIKLVIRINIYKTMIRKRKLLLGGMIWINGR